MAKILQFTMCLFRITVMMSNQETPYTHEARDRQFKYG